jgi:hypothetical protein
MLEIHMYDLDIVHNEIVEVINADFPATLAQRHAAERAADLFQSRDTSALHLYRVEEH